MYRQQVIMEAYQCSESFFFLIYWEMNYVLNNSALFYVDNKDRYSIEGFRFDPMYKHQSLLDNTNLPLVHP